jgi:hypothetical protein
MDWLAVLACAPAVVGVDFPHAERPRQPLYMLTTLQPVKEVASWLILSLTHLSKNIRFFYIVTQMVYTPQLLNI